MTAEFLLFILVSFNAGMTFLNLYLVLRNAKRAKR